MADGLAGGVFERTGRGIGTDVCRVGGSKAEGTVVVNVDLLATGDRNILLLLAHTYTVQPTINWPGYRTHQSTTVTNKSRTLALRARSHLGHGLGTVSRGLLAEPEVAAGGVHGEEVDFRGGAGGHDGESTLGAFVAGVREGQGQREDGEDSGELHFVCRSIYTSVASL